MNNLNNRSVEYPRCVKSWEEHWDIMSTFFEYPAEVRKIIFTTNIIDSIPS
ncbi:MAG: transposase [Oscillospiraceae bacterium]